MQKFESMELLSLPDELLARILVKALPSTTIECIVSKDAWPKVSMEEHAIRKALRSSNEVNGSNLLRSIQLRDGLARVCKRFHRAILHNTRVLLLDGDIPATAMREYGSLQSLHLLRGATHWPLSPPFLKGGELRSLTSLSILDDLGLDWSQVTFDTVPMLRELYTVNCRIPPVFLARLKHLTHLTLRDSGLEPHHLGPIGQLTTLQLLNLAWGRFPPDAPPPTPDSSLLDSLAAIGRVTTLQFLNFNHWPLTDDGVARLSSLKNLRHLCVAGCSLTGGCLRHIATFSALEVLDLRDCASVTAGREVLSSLTSLRHLNLLSCGDVTVGELHQLADRRQRNRILTRLCLHGFGDRSQSGGTRMRILGEDSDSDLEG